MTFISTDKKKIEIIIKILSYLLLILCFILSLYNIIQQKTYEKETKINLCKVQCISSASGNDSKCEYLTNENNTLNENYKKCYENIQNQMNSCLECCSYGELTDNTGCNIFGYLSYNGYKY